MFMDLFSSELGGGLKVGKGALDMGVVQIVEPYMVCVQVVDDSGG